MRRKLVRYALAITIANKHPIASHMMAIWKD